MGEVFQSNYLIFGLIHTTEGNHKIDSMEIKYPLCIVIVAIVVKEASSVSSWTQDGTKRCSRDCAVTRSSKLYYTPSKTYIYEYKGKSSLTTEGTTDFRWSAEIHLSYITPCDLAVAIKGVNFAEETNEQEYKELTAYPLVASVSEGHIQDVCYHPDDSAFGVNLKKGILSMFQNTLPSLSPIHSGRIVQEIDIAGQCPTTYEIYPKKSMTVITKYKNYKDCSLTRESLLTSVLLKSSIPLKESSSKCEQHIKDGIITYVRCNEHSSLQLTSRSARRLTAGQHVEMKYLRDIETTPFDFTDKFKRTGLLAQYVRPISSNSLVPYARELLKDICVNIDGKINPFMALRLMPRVIHILEQVPPRHIHSLLREVQQGSICPDKDRFQELFYDILSYVQQEGAIEVMVDKLTSANNSWIRTINYAVSIFLIKRPTSAVTSSLTTLINYATVPIYIKLFAANVIHQYCEYHPNCFELKYLANLFNTISTKIDFYCAAVGASTNKSEKEEVVLLLKLVGNIGHMNKNLEDSILKCATRTVLGVDLRVAAYESFRRSSCTHEKMRMFFKIATNTEEATETRIAAYLQFIRCADENYAYDMIMQLKLDPNKQVVAFILSHIENIQKSTSPLKRQLRYILSNIVIQDMLHIEYENLSRNVNFDYFSEELKVGGEVDVNIIFSAISNIPTQIDTNINIRLFEHIFNLQNIHLKWENAEQFLRILCGTNSCEDKSFISLKLLEIFTRKNVSPMSAIQSLFRWFKERDSALRNIDDKEKKFDASIRFFDMEAFFKSAMSLESHFNNTNEYLKTLMPVLEDIDYFNRTKLLHFGGQLSLPSITGIPLEIKGSTTALIGLTVYRPMVAPGGEIKASKLRHKFVPNFSMETNFFLGYDFHAIASIKGSIKIRSSDLKFDFLRGSNDISMQLDILKESILGSIRLENYMMKKLPGQMEEKIQPSVQNDPRIYQETCSKMADLVSGLQICWKYDLPNIIESDIAPFGRAATLKIYLGMGQSSFSGVQLSTSWKMLETFKEIKFDVRGVGIGNSKSSPTEIAIISDKKYVFVNLCDHNGRKLKIVFQNKDTKERTSKELSLFAGRKKVLSQDEVLHATFDGRIEENFSDFHFSFRTMNELYNILNANIQISGVFDQRKDDLYGPLGISFPKFEIKFGSGQLQAQTFLRKVSSEAKAEQYSLLSTLTRHGNVIFHIMGHVGIKGLLSENNFVTISNFKARIAEGIEYESNLEVVFNNLLFNISFDTRNLGEKEILLLWAVSHVRQSARSIQYSSDGQFVVAGYTPFYRISGDLLEVGDNIYEINYEFQENKVPVLEISGPVTWKVSYPEVTKQAAELTIIGPQNSSLLLDVLYYLDGDDVKLKLDIVRNEYALVKFGLKLKGRDKEISACRCNIFVSNYTEVLLNGSVSAEELRAEFTVAFFLEFAEMRKFKGFGIIDRNKKGLEAKLYHHANEKQNDVFHFDSTYQFSLDRRKLSIKGKVSKDNHHDYHFTTGIDLGAPASRDIRRHFIFSFTNPSDEQFKLGMLYHKDVYDEHKGDITTHFELRTFGDDHYELESNVCYVVEFPKKKFILVGKCRLVSPILNESVITYEASSDFHDEDNYQLVYKVEAASIGCPRKIKSSLSLNIYTNESWQVTPKLKLPELDFIYEIIVTSQTQGHPPFALLFSKERTGNTRFNLANNDNRVLDCEFLCSQNGNCILNLRSYNSNTLKAFSSISSIENTFTLYPNKRALLPLRKRTVVGEAEKYPANMNKSNRYSVDFVTASLPIRRTLLIGEIIIDSKSARNIISASLDMLHLSTESFEAEIIFISPVLKTAPRVQIQFAFTNLKKSFTANFKHEAGSPPTVTISGTLMKQSKSKEIYAFIKTPRDSVEYSGSLEALDLPDCFGSIVNSSIYSSSHGMHDFSVILCRPSYISLFMMSPQSDCNYAGKLGRKTTYAEVAIEKTCKSNNSKDILIGSHSDYPSLRVFSYLWMPYLVSIDAEYHTEDLVQIGQKLQGGLKAAIKTSASILKDVVEEFLEKTLDSDGKMVITELKEISTEVLNKILNMGENLRQEKLFLLFGNWTNKIHADLKYVINKYRETTENAVQTLKHYLRPMIEFITKALEEVNAVIISALKYIYKELKKVACTFSNMFEDIVDFEELWEHLEATELWKWLQNEWNYLRHIFKEEIDNLKQVLQTFLKYIQTELNHVLEKTCFPLTEKIINYIKHWIKGNAVKAEFHKNFAFQLETEYGHIRLQIPMRYPVYSLWAALGNVGIPQFKQTATTRD